MCVICLYTAQSNCYHILFYGADMRWLSEFLYDKLQRSSVHDFLVLFILVKQ